MKRALRKPLASLVAFSLVLGLVPLHALADETPTLPEEPVALEEVLTEEPAPVEVVPEEPAAAPVEEAPAEKAAPEEETDTEEAASAEEAAPVEEAAPEDEPAAADPAAPAEETAPVAKAETAKAAVPMLTPQATTIDSVSITVTPPTAGEKDVNAATLVSIPTSAHCSLKSAYWVLGDSSSTIVTPTTDIDDNPYALAITLKADEGYEFKDGSSYTVTGATPQDGGKLWLYDSIEANANVLVTPAKGTTVDMRVWTPGHGKVLVNGSDYDTEFQGTWFEGTEVSIEAVPADGYKFNRWWIKASNQDNNRRVTTPGTTLVAGNDVDAVAYFGLETAEITITAPSAGSKASTAPDVTVPSGAGYSIQGDSMWGPGLSWVQSAEIGAAALDPATTFEAGQTYYAKVRLRDGADSFAAKAGGSEFDTNLSVTGGVKQWQSNGAYTEKAGEGGYSVYIGIEAVIAVTIPEAETHTVTFDTQGGSAVASQEVADGAYATKPANPKKDGFFFLGWYEKPGAQLTREEVHANKPVGFDFAKTAITEDKTLYAVWYEGFYGATYDLSAKTPKYAETGGNVTFTSTYQQKPEASKVWWDYSIVEGSEVTVTAIPAAGARFVGWAPGTLNSSGNMPDDPASLGDIVSTDTSYTFTFDGKTALAALFEKEAPADVTVSFDAKGGTPVPAAQTFKAGEKATEPAAPAKSGWGFGGWYTDEALSSKFDFGSVVNDDTTLYARWNGQIDISSYDSTTDKYDSGGTFACETAEWTGEGLYSYGSGSIAEGSTVSLTATPAEGNRFVGWAKDSVDGTIVSEDETYEFTFIKNPTRLYAVFEEIPPTLTLHWTSVGGDDLVTPIAIEASPGMNVGQALNLYGGSDMTTDVFATAKEGYVWSGHQMPKPLSAYKSIDDLNAARVKGTDSIGKGLDIYYVMLKEIDAVEVSVEAPKCGVETKMVDNEQTNPPAMTLAGSNYGPAFEGQPVAMWGEWKTDHSEPFGGTFEGGKDYSLLALLAADFGYCFADDVTATVTGAKDAQPLTSSDSPLLVLGVSAQVTAEHIPGETVTENVVPATCTEAGSHDEVVYCTACKAELSRKTVTDPALGHDWGEWTVVKEATEEADGLEQRTCKRCKEVEERVIPKLVVEYTCAAGDGQTWTKGSGTAMEFTFKRSIADETCFSHFTGVRVDGKALSAKDYTAKAGSTVVTLSAEYLETLAVGKHTLTAQFDDGNGEATASFTVAEKEAPAPAPDPAKKDEAKPATKPAGKLPQTGDPFALVSLTALTLALVGLAATLAGRRIRE